MTHEAKLTDGPIVKTILNLAWPMILGMIGIVVFDLIDTFYIGRLGTANLAAMSYTLPVVLLQAFISLGLGVGAAAVISMAIGLEKHDQVQRMTTDSLFLSLCIVIALILLGLFTMNPLFRAMGAKGDSLVLVKKYMFIWYFGVPFVVIPIVGNNAIRAAGNTFIPFIIILIAVIVNLVLDPLLIFGIGPFPKMEIQGAALATVIANATSLVFALLILRFKYNMLTAKIPELKIMLKSWKKILFIGIPATITQFLAPIALGIITRIVSNYGDVAVAAFGVGNRIERFALAPIFGLAAIMVPFAGQNFGAKKGERIREGNKYAFLFAMVLGFICFLILTFSGKSIAFSINKNPQIIDFVGQYLFISSIAYGFLGVLMIVTSIFNGLNKPFQALAVNFLRMFFLYIPLAITGSLLFGLIGVFTSACISSILAGIISWFWLKWNVKKIPSE